MPHMRVTKFSAVRIDRHPTHGVFDVTLWRFVRAVPSVMVVCVSFVIGHGRSTLLVYTPWG